jgi:dolichol-phosphate mannosyltransferase
VGSRYVPGGRIENWPWPRRALSGGANALARIMVGDQVHDWTAGFKCYGRAALASLDLDRIRSEGYSFQVEILFHCRRAGWKIQEVPITFVDRRLGRTKMSRREVYQAMVTLLRIAWRRLAG